ncbi:uncharacterized protein plekhg6 [Centroberyx gerrardi]
MAGGNESPMDETAAQWRDGGEGERQRDTETKEPEVVDGTTPAAEIILHHRGSADKHKFNTSGYQRRTKQKVVTDFATVSKGASAGTKPRAALRQVLFSQGVSDKNPAPEERGQLDVLKQALETYPVPVSLKWRWEEERHGTTLEKNWTDIVHSHSTMSKMQRHQQEALWEFVHTELTYINKLTVIQDLVIAALVNLHQHGFLQEVTPDLLFSNLPSILSAHHLFWQEVMYPMLQEVRRTGQPFDPMRLEAGCLQFHERFSSYLPYCWEEESNLELTRRQMDTNPHFLTYVQWVETHPQCERMRLGDMQAKPHQRITKYPLLLKAVLKTTQDPQVQHTLRGMLSSVNGFLESINDYLRLNDEELALSISAQRVEGYEVEGINEEIDRHVREICQFDLTCPIRGVGPGVVRKLLLEENLKIRGRKDSKLEVVALLFSDVLLMTKVQKKGERLRVVRPPLALDRTFCVALKDGCSFVLVEVGELGCAMNVYIFATTTSESCSTWVSTIHQAQETLKDLRETEKNKQLDNWRVQQFEAKPVMEAKMDNMETIKQPLKQAAEETFVDKFIEEPIISPSLNGMLKAKVTETKYQPSHPVASNSTGLAFWQSKSSDNRSKSVYGGFAGKEGREWIEMAVRAEQGGNHGEEEELVTVFHGIKERRVTWNHNTQSASHLGDNFIPSRNTADPLRHKPSGPHSLLLGGYPDVDYPTTPPGTLLSPYGEYQPTQYQPTVSMVRPEFQRLPGARGRSTWRDSDSQSVDEETRRNSWYNQSGEEETLPEPWKFSRKLKSPRLRRRRPISSHHAPPQMFRQGSQDLGVAWSAVNTNSSSNSDSDCNQKLKGSSASCGQSSDSHRVLKLGSLKLNQGMFWNMPDERGSPNSRTFSEPELPDQNFHYKRPKLKTQRSASIPDIIIQGGHRLHLPSSSLQSSTLPRVGAAPSPTAALDPQARVSPLEGLLERAKVRVRDRDGVRPERNKKMPNMKAWYPPPSPSFSTTPSQSPSDGDRETEWEEVELMRSRAPTVSKGWKEQLVDGDEEEKKSSLVFADGVNVDWPGWCFDDDEVMDHLNPEDYSIGDEGLLEGISRTLTLWDFHGLVEQEEGECSQV